MRSISLAFTVLTSGALIGVSLGSCSDSDDDCSGGECSSNGGESGAPSAGRGGGDKGGSGGASGAGTSGGTTNGGTGNVGGGGASGDGGEGGAGTGGPQPCDATGSPSSEACLVDEEFAVFVAPQGDNAGDGT